MIQKIASCLRQLAILITIFRVTVSLKLAAQTELGNDLAVTVNISALQIVQQGTTAANHFQQTAAAMKVFFVYFQMFGQMSDLMAQNSDLNFRRTGIAFMNSESLNDLFFSCSVHCFPPKFFIQARN